MLDGEMYSETALETWDGLAARRCGVTDGLPIGLVVQRGGIRRLDLPARKNLSKRNPPASLPRNEV